MLIEASKHAKNNYVEPVVPAGQLVNRIGKYFYKHLDGAFKMEKTANMCDVYTTVLYEIPPEVVKICNLENSPYAEVNELNININITTYQNKIRVNLIEMSPEERTISHDVFPPEKLQDMRKAYELIWGRLMDRLEDEFAFFDFVF
jgi:hypothetical protein